MKSLNEMEELKRFQGSTFDEFWRRRLTENQDTINELRARIQELQNEVNCMYDSRVFKDAEAVRSGLSHVPSQPVSFPGTIRLVPREHQNWTRIGSSKMLPAR